MTGFEPRASLSRNGIRQARKGRKTGKERQKGRQGKAKRQARKDRLRQKGRQGKLQRQARKATNAG